MKITRTLLQFLLIVILAACGGKTPASPEPTAEAASATAASSASDETSPEREAILKALEGMQGQKHRTRNNIHLLESGETQDTVVEYVPPDRYHIIAGAQEIIVMGTMVYLKVGEQWELNSKLPAAQVVDSESLTWMATTLEKIKAEGQETLDGKAMQVYSYQSANRAGDLWLVSQTRLWVGAADGLPYKLESQGDIQGVIPANGKAVKRRAVTTMLIEYDPTIEIEVSYR